MPELTSGRGRSPFTLTVFLAALAVLSTGAPLSVPIAGQSGSTPQTVRLLPSDAYRLAREAREKVSVQLIDGLEIALWAHERLVADPIALDIDGNGVVYVVATPRTVLPLDIRQHADWVPDVHTITSTEDLRQFFRRILAPERSAQNTWMPDLNKDGVRDFRDLAVIKERVYRLEDTNGDGIADLSKVAYDAFPDDIGTDIAGGVLINNGNLYVTMAPDVWRLREIKDGVFGNAESISSGYSTHPAVSGHDLSALTVGPDGRIYWKVGDIGMNVVDKTGRRWTLPNRGSILRADPDGSNFEVFASGLRNPQEIAFDEHGNLVSVDNDGDYPGETERIVYITQGSDAGWRTTWQYGKYTDASNNKYNVWTDESLYKPRFAGQAAYIVPPVAPYHPGPAGFAYNPGTALDERWRGHFFSTSFTGTAAGARLYAFQLRERGAGFDLAADTQLLRGVLSPGLKVGPDGALYMTDWMTGWSPTGTGRVWKLDAPAAASTPIRAEVRALLGQDFASRPTVFVQPLMSHQDMRVRQKAQFELVRRRDVDALLAVARRTDSPLARIHAIWGLGQLARVDGSRADSLVQFLTDGDAEIRAQAAKTLGDVRSAPAASALVPLLRDSSSRTRFFAAEALGRIAYRPAVQPLVQMLADNDDRDDYLRHAGSLALASIGDVGSLAALTTHSSRAVRLASVVALRRMRDPAVSQFLNDSDELVVTEAARAINDDGSIAAALPALALVLGQTQWTSDALVRRAISANVRMGTADAVARVTAAAARTNLSAAVRAEAVAALATWAAPSLFDRVDGAYLGAAAQPRDAGPAREAVTRLAPLLDQPESSVELKLALVNAIERHHISAAAPALLERLQDDDSAQVRVGSMNALAKVGGDAEALTRVALADADPVVRRAAINMVTSLPLTEAAKVRHLNGVVETGPLAERQSALSIMSRVKSPEVVRVLGSLVDRLAAGRLEPAIQLDVIEAVRGSAAPALSARLEELRLTRTLDNLAAVFPAALERGGDVTRGREVWADHPGAQCTSCHTLGAVGGDARPAIGPSLAGLGSRLSRAEILQSLVEPSARTTPGFGSVSINLKSGRHVDGVIRDESRAFITVDTGQALERVATADIVQRANVTSLMPPMASLLRPQEIRDLIEFLATLK